MSATNFQLLNNILQKLILKSVYYFILVVIKKIFCILFYMQNNCELHYTER